MLRAYFKKEKSLLIWFIVSSIVIVIWLLLLEVNEKFKYGAELGIVFSTISFGYIVSYIFYYLVVFRKREIDIRNISSYLSMKLTEICIIGFSSYNSLFFKLKNEKADFPPNLETLIAALRKQDPIYSFVSNNHGKLNWYKYLNNLNRDFSEIIDQIWSVFPFMNTELVKYLIELKECKLSKCANYAIIPIESRLKESNFKSWKSDIKDQLYEFYQIIYQIKLILDTNFNEFNEHKELRESRLDR